MVPQVGVLRWCLRRRKSARSSSHRRPRNNNNNNNNNNDNQRRPATSGESGRQEPGLRRQIHRTQGFSKGQSHLPRNNNSNSRSRSSNGNSKISEINLLLPVKKKRNKRRRKVGVGQDLRRYGARRRSSTSLWLRCLPASSARA